LPPRTPGARQRQAFLTPGIEAGRRRGAASGAASGARRPSALCSVRVDLVNRAGPVYGVGMQVFHRDVLESVVVRRFQDNLRGTTGLERFLPA